MAEGKTEVPMVKIKTFIKLVTLLNVGILVKEVTHKAVVGVATFPQTFPLLNCFSVPNQLNNFKCLLVGRSVSFYARSYHEQLY